MSMTDELRFADPGDGAGLAAFLGRLLRYDRAAAVRLQSKPAGGGAALAVFGRAPALDVIVVRTAALTGASELDVTVSAGELLEGVDGSRAAVPAPVTGPSWAGLLPPRGGWRELPGLPDAGRLRGAVAAGITEFRSRVDALPEDKRTRSELDRIGGEIWGRLLGGTPAPLRAAHAAHVFGLLPEDARAALLEAGSWLRLRTPYGSVALRRAGGLPGLGITPT